MDEITKNIRTLVVDTVQQANSGHPGAPLGLSKFIYILYRDFLKFNPDDQNWIGRDIFLLSNGHACVIQYIMNYLFCSLTLDDLKQFRQINSKTPGHPERKCSHIESTTGPLGQGLSNAVGFAISLKKLQLDNTVYCVFGDGCYQEGIGQESFSICANLGLDNITFIYDFNKVSIDGHTDLSMNEDVVMRFRSLGFYVIEVDGENDKEIKEALDFKINKTKMIILHTKIGRDSIFEDNHKAHGSPIGEEGVRKLKEKYNFPQIPFYVSKSLQEESKRIKETKKEIAKKHKIEIAKFNVQDFEDAPFSDQETTNESLATRKVFYNLLNKIKNKERIICGSADLASSTLCKFENSVDFNTENRSGNYIHYGIREHSMCGIMNGIASHGFFLPFSGTFLNFISYGHPSVRLACLDNLNVVYVLTHDSIGLGEDGPTHQPIETVATLRATPNLITLRPSDENECRAALRTCLTRVGPKAVILSRQTLPFNKETCEEKAMRGAYYLVEDPNADAILMATGSEVHLGLQVLQSCKDLKLSLVSFFSWELFEQQSDEYKASILRNIPKISIEALSTFGWSKYSDFQIGIDHFGASGKAKDIFENEGFTAEKILQRIYTLMRK
ncbi:Transketolase 1 [Nosema granulosis]|uniref:transketolase n=1 Tax=Nosema granulosis TaxID=83296 RepID=A0A9P6H0G2_9MICR|nr:Transketolase 1 [Nosema granulosis]